jgi:hypothetical protein
MLGAIMGEADPTTGPDRAEGERETTMRPLLVAFITTCFSMVAFAQTATPSKPPSQAKPKPPLGCKFVGTVKGTKLWAGDCVGLRGVEPAETETPSPGSKQ